MTGNDHTTGDRPAGRRGGRFVPWAVIGLWVAALVAMMPFAMELESVQSDRPVDYLPASAGSTRVAELEDRLPGGDNDDYIVVYHRPGGLTEADRAAVERQRSTLVQRFGDPASVPGQDGPDEEGDEGTTASRDGTALMFLLPVSTDRGEPEDLVVEIRAVVADRPAGLDAKVTGPPAVDADLDEVFDGIDATLLIATIAVVTILLVLTYRSPVLWLVPLAAVGCAAILSMAAVYLLVKAFGITVSTQSASILTVLVFGAGTDYALLLVARYREELRHVDDVRLAMRNALRGVGPAVVASAATVMAGLLCLLAADLNSTRGLGPVGAAGIACALLAMLTLFPALLVVLGRRVFWPAVPRTGTADSGRPGLWARLGGFIARRRTWSMLGSLAVLGVLALGLTGPTNSLREQDQFVNTPESVAGFAVLATHYPELGGQPITVLSRPAQRDQVLAVVAGTRGITQAVPGRAGADWAEITAFPADAPDTPAESATIERLRTAVGQVAGAEALVGGPSAENLDQAATSERDRAVVIPLVLAVVLVILGILLRAIVAPVILVGTVVLSFAAALGASVFVFDRIFGFEGIDHSVPLLGFLFLIALGVDYNIFLMNRAREETAAHGTRAGTLRALTTTGGVITSAGLVLAATFAVLATLPLVLMIELGFLVALGVLLDTFLVRSVLVPAVALVTGRRIWWPGGLWRRPDEPSGPSGPSGPAGLASAEPASAEPATAESGTADSATAEPGTAEGSTAEPAGAQPAGQAGGGTGTGAEEEAESLRH
ncbi:MMPL family transporter [Plantactinospora endophytica]|uniref:Membrane protein n=1 Tax=Plantactinospora endophytica TaxID=673535 RepID=A0ABQ4EBH4_9ACTN|nr:MMPL family transporter [Plantactinospora endophytica]GIG92085.1 membrane protein [Plantactinospora endophytica]